jgi:hypothetical protein
LYWGLRDKWLCCNGKPHHKLQGILGWKCRYRILEREDGRREVRGAWCWISIRSSWEWLLDRSNDCCM